MHAERQHPGQRRAEVDPAAVFHRDNRLPARARIAAERKHRDLRVNAWRHHTRRVGTHGQLFRAGLAPAGRRRPAAAAFQREDEIEHSASVTTAGDNLPNPPSGHLFTRSCV